MNLDYQSWNIADGALLALGTHYIRRLKPPLQTIKLVRASSMIAQVGKRFRLVGLYMRACSSVRSDMAISNLKTQWASAKPATGSYIGQRFRDLHTSFKSLISISSRISSRISAEGHRRLVCCLVWVRWHEELELLLMKSPLIIDSLSTVVCPNVTFAMCLRQEVPLSRLHSAT